MGIRDDLTRSFGDDFFLPAGVRTPYRNWRALCVCGHLDRYHSPSVGGTYTFEETYTSGGQRGRGVTTTVRFLGCVGAMPGRGAERYRTVEANPSARTKVDQLTVTCPCTQMQPVASVDRPNRYFCQRVPATITVETPRPEQLDRHPMLIGMRAFLTHLSRRKSAHQDPDWVDQEFERRFVWLPDAHRCAISGCGTTENVWPVYVTEDGAVSELRCTAHLSSAAL